MIRRLWHSLCGRIQCRHDELKLNQGRILTELHRQKNSKNLQDYEFKVFSERGEDGILQKFVRSIEIKNKTFIEFGVEDFFESNCRFLMMKDNWSGFVIDGCARNIRRLKSAYFYWRFALDAISAFITKDNINTLLAQSGFDDDIGVLSIDLDGNDFWILQAIDRYRPRILIVEYNSVFGLDRKITVPYDPQFQRTQKHSSNLYWGASLAALASIAFERGYTLVGTNSGGNNAFFVRNNVMTDALSALSVTEAFTASKYRESRFPDGSLSYVGGGERSKLIAGMPVVNTETNALESL
jgi:hypothetical protein